MTKYNDPMTPSEIPEYMRVTPIEISPSTMVQWLKPEAVGDIERRWVDQLEPGDYEIYDEKLNNILDEAREIFVRSGVTNLLTAGDLIVAIYTANGDLANASAGTYLHCVTGCLPVKYVMFKFFSDPSVRVEEGDIFYTNEARYGGIHNPDQMAFMPVFHEGGLLTIGDCHAAMGDGEATASAVECALDATFRVTISEDL